MKPNVVIILSDDFGYGSLGCYGAPANLKTPYLDRLAREGRRFTQTYAPGSVCSPTRYGLVTGRNYWRTDVKDGEVPQCHPGVSLCSALRFSGPIDRDISLNVVFGRHDRTGQNFESVTQHSTSSRTAGFPI